MRKLKQRAKPPPLGITREESKNDSQRLAMVPHKQPLIIHTFSPEVIHADAYNFMNLVQRLTGKTSHASPPSKRPRYAPHCMLLPSPRMRHASVSSELQHGDASSDMPHLPHSTPKEQRPASVPKSPLEPQQVQQRLASRRGFSPKFRLGLKVQTAPFPHRRVGEEIQGGALVKSPRVFEFSPSMLPTPPAILHDFPSLSPYADVAGLLSPRVTRIGAVARSPVIMPSILPSPGPLTSAFLVDLPALSPATHSWLDKHPLSTELILSPLSRGFGSTPIWPRGHERSLV